jgi:hypothetical protein
MRDLLEGHEDGPLYTEAVMVTVVLAQALKEATEVLDAILLIDHERAELRAKPASDIEGKC